MNTKTLIILFIAGIVIVGGASFVLLKAKSSQKQSGVATRALKEDKNPNNLNYLATQGKVLPVILSEAGAVPPSIKLNKGEAVNFTNTTKQDLELKVTGILNTIVKIPAGKSQISPIFSISGLSKFEDKKNPKISGEIIVEGLSDDINKDKVDASQPTNVFPTSKPIKDAEVIVMSTGASPSVVRIIKEQRVKFINKTTQDLAIRIEGKVSTIARTNLDNTYDSIIFRESGTYKYADIKNSSIKGEIIVE